MSSVTYLLLSLLLCWLGFGACYYLRRRYVLVIDLTSEEIPDEMLEHFGLMPAEPEANSHAEAVPSPAPEEGFAGYLRRIAENADPEAPGQAILYIRDIDLTVISSGLVARISHGERYANRLLREQFFSHPDSKILVADFGMTKVRGIGRAA